MTSEMGIQVQVLSHLHRLLGQWIAILTKIGMDFDPTVNVCWYKYVALAVAPRPHGITYDSTNSRISTPHHSTNPQLHPTRLTLISSIPHRPSIKMPTPLKACLPSRASTRRMLAAAHHPPAARLPARGTRDNPIVIHDDGDEEPHYRIMRLDDDEPIPASPPPPALPVQYVNRRGQHLHTTNRWRSPSPPLCP